ncbi:Ydr279p protein family (RNase H2 complex component) [Geosmithia morbida]|uniref:Ribonuclease H2 subunit B n=1 Tax=Geosmithia morbida TaxID=1094350 RepID=A0A9P4Z0G0_9HYPO|nr:Ydr279p protein family (RNase H2 complex component) [Geosmithia morbida]KAF4124364.1 Ydr279p protein family (RNase H2 complex component) [Geosmithia morbida]
MPRTRSATGAVTESEKTDTSKASSSKIQLPPRTESPPKLFVLPTKATKDAAVITLPHPRHAKPSRYLVCPETGFYEFTRIASPKNTPRSWLIASERADATTTAGGRPTSSIDGQAVSCADLFIATPMDPMFLLLPSLAESVVGKNVEGQKRLFLSSEDYFDNLPSESSHLGEILRWNKTRALLESRMAAVCDTVEAGDELMYRLSRDKILATCLEKARCLVEGDALPPSLEKQFVTRVLQAPVINQKSASNQTRNVTEAAESDEPTTQQEPKTSGDSSTAAADGESGEVEQAIKPTDEIVKLQKLKVALDLICQRLVSPELTAWLNEGLRDPGAGGVSFAPLDQYLAKLEELRAEAVASRSIGDYSSKRLRDEEEEEVRELKKKKADEEKRRKANESRGVRDLKKVNVSGMKKLSHFFQKK